MEVVNQLSEIMNNIGLLYATVVNHFFKKDILISPLKKSKPLNLKLKESSYKTLQFITILFQLFYL